MFINILRFISLLISFYTLILFVRVILTWIPSLEYSKFGKILAEICDPYLNLFKKARFLRTGPLDFTPILAIGVLVIISSLLQSIVTSQRVSVGVLIGSVISLCWSVIHAVLVVLMVVIFIRLIVSIFDKDSSSSVWAQLDKMISPVAYRLTNMVFPNKYIKYQTVLIVALVALILCHIILEIILMGVIANFFISLPF
ncbi:MAG: YggT family protein [Spirochaetaceae bacterium]|nr:YggT family protein [Spirochaetaceae bacterium]